MRRHRNQERGAAMVEFALILPMLLLILLGTIDWGWYFFVREVVTNAAREGARTGAIVGSGEVGAANTYLAGSGLNQIATSCSDGTSSCVSIIYPTGSITGFLSPPLIPIDARAQARMRRE